MKPIRQPELKDKDGEIMLLLKLMGVLPSTSMGTGFHYRTFSLQFTTKQIFLNQFAVIVKKLQTTDFGRRKKL